MGLGSVCATMGAGRAVVEVVLERLTSSMGGWVGGADCGRDSSLIGGRGSAGFGRDATRLAGLEAGFGVADGREATLETGFAGAVGLGVLLSRGAGLAWTVVGER